MNRLCTLLGVEYLVGNKPKLQWVDLIIKRNKYICSSTSLWFTYI